jgi:hypothetical protein
LFPEDNQAISIESLNLFPIQEERNNSYFLTELNISPDSIIRSDTNKLLKGNPVIKDSITGFNVISASPKLSRKAKIESELPPTEIANERPKPDFILSTEANSSLNYIRLNNSVAKLKKSLSKQVILDKSGTGEFEKQIVPEEKKSSLQDWFTIILVLAIVLIAWVRSFFGRYFQQSIQSLYDYTLSTRVFKNRNVLLPRISFLLLVNFVIITSLFAFKSLEIINLSTFKSSFSNFMLLNLLLLGLISFRFITFHGLNILFPRNQSIMEYYYQVQNYYKSIGLIMLPILIFEAYYPSQSSKTFLWLGLGAILVLYFNRLIRGQRIVKRMNLRFSYLFLYILSFEILPISICFKIFSEII